MIIKSITHTSHRASIKNLIRYVFGDINMQNEHGESVRVSNLLHGKRSSWAKQFERNQLRRKSKYGTKAVRYYHEIISFHPDSKPSKQQVEQLMWKYLELRLNVPVLAFGACHFSDHHHAHFVIAGTDFYGKSTRTSKRAFRDIQVRMNEIQQELFPELEASYVDYEKRSRNPEKLHSHNAQKRSERTKERPRKERLHEVVQHVFINSDNIESFIANLSMKDIEVYFRRGVLTGVVFEKTKFRLRKSLGVDFEKLLKRDLQQERLARIKALKESKQNDQNKER